MEIMFLLGSGVSIPAGMPSTQNISSTLLSGEKIWRHTDSNYYLGVEPSIQPDNSYLRRVVEGTQIINSELLKFYKSIPDINPNYEDIYFIADSLYAGEMSLNRPDLAPLLEKYYSKFQHLLQPIDADVIQHKLSFVDLFSEIRNYIRDVVWHLLNTQPRDISYFKVFKDALEDPNIAKSLIFTLNHDILVEKYFNENSVQYFDGFKETKGDFRVWSPRSFKSVQNDSILKRGLKNICHSKLTPVYLYKIHGSINWFSLVNDDYDPESRVIGIPRKSDFWHLKDSNGIMQWPESGRPMILVGTENKPINYSSGIYLALISEFYSELTTQRKIIISGYNFGDRGINRLLFNWLDSRTQNRILYVSPSGKIPKLYEDRFSDKITIIQKGFQELSYPEISSFLTK